MDVSLPIRNSHDRLTDMVCWTRMQAESGQNIEVIIARKELERRTGGGLFFWGVGNAPIARSKISQQRATKLMLSFRS